MLSSLADGAETGLGVVQPDGRSRYANPSFRRMLNIPADDDSGRSLAEILPQWTELAGRAGKPGSRLRRWSRRTRPTGIK
ncbi:PAS domain-containing protein [Paenibacillus sp. P26]|nr:PAS domain-containing protein [Paenibacillus sp. P26]